MNGIIDLLPSPPWIGPPLPRFLGIRWPWLQGGEESFSLPSLPSLPLLPLPKSPTEIITSRPELTTYENIEEIELQDIDPELLMPRKIVIHRKAKRGNG